MPNSNLDPPIFETLYGVLSQSHQLSTNPVPALCQSCCTPQIQKFSDLLHILHIAHSSCEDVQIEPCDPHRSTGVPLHMHINPRLSRPIFALYIPKMGQKGSHTARVRINGGIIAAQGCTWSHDPCTAPCERAPPARPARRIFQDLPSAGCHQGCLPTDVTIRKPQSRRAFLHHRLLLKTPCDTVSHPEKIHQERSRNPKTSRDTASHPKKIHQKIPTPKNPTSHSHKCSTPGVQPAPPR